MPRRRSRNCSRASTTLRSIPRCRRKVCSTWSRSWSRSRPWSTKMQVSRSPTARWTSAAATEESTPPDKAADHPRGRADPRLNPGDFLLDEVPRRPVGRAATDAEEEIADDLAAPRGVRHLRVELHGMDRAGLVLQSADRGILTRRGDAIARWRGIHVIAVGHPDRGLFTRRQIRQRGHPDSTRTRARPYSRRADATTCPPARCESNCIP